MSSTKYVDQHYVPHVEPARACSQQHPSLRALLGDELGATAQLGALIQFCAVGVRVLRPLENILRRAVSVCVTVGLDDLGHELGRCSQHAADRRLLLVDDLVQLAQLWREQVLGGESRLDLRYLVRQPLPTAAMRYAALHEDTPLDELPFLALGTQIELAEFAKNFGPQLMRACERKLGSEVFAGMRYIQAAAEDAALTQVELLDCLGELLRVAPDFGDLVAGAGAEAVLARIHVWAVCVRRGAQLVHADDHAVVYL